MQRPHKELLIPASTIRPHHRRSCSCQFKDGLIQYDRDDDVSVRLDHGDEEKKLNEERRAKSTFDVRYADSENGKNCISKIKTRVEWREKRACMHLIRRCAAVESHIRNVSISLCFSFSFFFFALLCCWVFHSVIFLFRVISSLLSKKWMKTFNFSFRVFFYASRRGSARNVCSMLISAVLQTPNRPSSQCTDRWYRVDAWILIKNSTPLLGGKNIQTWSGEATFDTSLSCCF